MIVETEGNTERYIDFFIKQEQNQLATTFLTIFPVGLNLLQVKALLHRWHSQALFPVFMVDIKGLFLNNLRILMLFSKQISNHRETLPEE